MTRFTCSKALRCLDDLHGGVISAADREALDVHLAVCDACRGRAELWGWIGELGRTTELRRLPEVQERRLLSGKGLKPSVRSVSRGVGRRGLVAAAALVAVAVLVPVAAVSLSWWRPFESRATDPAAPLADTEAEVEAGTADVSDPPDPADESAPPEPGAELEIPLESVPASGDAIAEMAPCPDLESTRAGTPQAALPTIEELSRSAREHRRAREFALACDDYQRLRDLYPDSPEAAASQLALGQMKLSAMGQPDGAVDHFRAYLAEAPEGDLAEDARVGEIRALAALGRHSEVNEACVQYQRWHPRGSATAEALHYRADALLALGRDPLALEVYLELQSGWPDTSHGAWARVRIEGLEGSVEE